ncbi:MAG: ribonuclease 3 [Gammaproteobacteria bacterium]|nr:MAG: ribonuclease 3 [Gammaproteobacteria bacterium]
MSEAFLGHRFSDPDLLARALTHRSAGGANNERLEFLGDSLLSLVIAEELYRRHPELSEGDLSRLRAALVNRETLAELAAELGLGERLALGPGELKSGGFRRRSILADALEAVLGAVYLDAGFEAAADLVRRLWAARLDAPVDPAALKDAKTRLQEWLQGRGRALPAYDVVAVEGKPHAQRFTVQCRVEGLDAPVIGEGASRRQAEQRAAEAALAKLEARAR